VEEWRGKGWWKWWVDGTDGGSATQHVWLCCRCGVPGLWTKVVTCGPPSPLYRPRARRSIEHWTLWCMASSTTDLHLPSRTRANDLPRVVAWKRNGRESRNHILFIGLGSPTVRSTLGGVNLGHIDILSRVCKRQQRCGVWLSVLYQLVLMPSLELYNWFPSQFQCRSSRARVCVLSINLAVFQLSVFIRFQGVSSECCCLLAIRHFDFSFFVFLPQRSLLPGV